MIRVRENWQGIKCGSKIGVWTVLGHLFAVKYAWWGVVQCKCGEIAVRRIGSLLQCKSSCANCAKKEWSHGASGTRLYGIWESMKRRCSSPTGRAWHRYGGRGIRVCDEWQKFEPFRDWAKINGYADKLTLDRIDNDGNYEPANCRWITRREQGRNKSTNRHITAFGETKTLVEWAGDSRSQVKAVAIHQRISRGMTPEEAIATPVRKPTRNGSTCR